MWILIVVTMLTMGSQYGANYVKEIRFNSEIACFQAAAKLNEMFTEGRAKELNSHPVKAFCVKDSGTK